MAYEALEQAIQALNQTNTNLVQTVQDKWASANSAAAVAEQAAAAAGNSEVAAANSASSAEASQVSATASEESAAASAAAAYASEVSSAASESGAAASATAAASAADAAASAADAAQLSAGVYATTAAGLAATADGDYFSVPSAESDEYLILYRHSGALAVEQKRYPATGMIAALENQIAEKISSRSSDDGVMFTLQDQAQREVLAVMEDGTVTPRKLAIPETARIGADTLRDLVMRSVTAESGYLFRLEDMVGRFLAGILDDGTFDPAKLSGGTLLDGKAALRDLVMSAATAESGYLFRLEDQAGRFLAGVTTAGAFELAKLSSDTKLDDGVTKIVDGLLKGLTAESGYLFSLEDQAARLLIGLREDGALRIAKLASDTLLDDGVTRIGDLLALGATAPEYVSEIVGSSPNRMLYVNSLVSGKRSLVTTSGDPENPQITRDGHVLFDSSSGPRHAGAPDWAVYPLFPSAEVTAFGDSLTAANWINSVIGPALGVPVYNQGNSGYGSADIAILQGGLVPNVTLSGNAIPASGPVSVTAIEPATGYTSATSPSFTGTLAGVPGVLSKTSGNPGTWTFTRSVEGSAVSVPPGTPFICTNGLAHESRVQIIWVGRNNVPLDTFSTDVFRDVKSCVDYLKPYCKRYVVISVTNGQSEPRGTARYDKIVAHNQRLEDTYGECYFDLRRYMIDNGLADAGITPTTADLAAMANDAPPPSIMADDIHFSSAGFTVVGNAILDFIQTKEWF